jgi:hypothetical protein
LDWANIGGNPYDQEERKWFWVLLEKQKDLGFREKFPKHEKVSDSFS